MNIRRTRSEMGAFGVFPFIRRIFVRRLTLMKIHTIVTALNAAIRAAAQSISGRHFSRKSPLTAEAVIRLFISAEGGCLAKILHTAGLDMTDHWVQKEIRIAPFTLLLLFPAAEIIIPVLWL